MERVILTFAKWLLICTICAMPSALWAHQEFDALGMSLGVLTFVLLYTAVNLTETIKRIESRPFVRRSLLIGFGVRIAVSVLFPLGAAIDLIPGMIAVELIAQTRIPESAAITRTYFTTLLQGVFVNCILLAFILLVYGIQRAVCQAPAPPDDICASCGYDIRASRQFGRCPECGTACWNPRFRQHAPDQA